MRERDERRGHGRPDDATEAALRRHLAERADAVDAGAPPRVADLLAAAPARRWPAAVGIAAAVGVLVAATAVAVQVPTADDPVVAASPSQTTTGPVATSSAPTTPAPTTSVSRPSTAPTAAGPTAVSTTDDVAPTADPTGPAPSDPQQVLVWVSRPEASGAELRVVPERRTVDTGDGSTEARVAAALRALLSGPPADPDHVSGWWWEDDGVAAPWDGSGEIGVSLGEDGTTVDVPRAATGAPLGSFGTATAVQELVRTVVSNGGTAPVTVLVDGGPAELWGAVLLDAPVAPETGLLAGGWVLDPWQGQRLPAGTVRVSGTATAFEGTVSWQVREGTGAVVDSGFTQAGANGEYGPFSFTTDLGPGEYTVRVFTESMSGDEGAPVLWESTTDITVVG
ncbi:Gmad2 immunoglobulin-like domain-containing protein [Aquipuribacter nitratireducens]|uniref:Gmad2 immunoglobulin-like domain-containing protein n=1 Tax=Aquipuribacter nitratireducens TaxID=650104 RepID=A0ABW0GJJ6_9MICO